MTAGFIFVIAILVLGGVIATVSDRLGTKVGKARLSLFKMRPRNTAAVVTIFTGTLLSGLTLAILFATSKPLRRGVFTIDQIQDSLNQSRKDLTRTEDEKERVETELTRAEAELSAAVNRLDQINASLNNTQVQVSDRETQLQQTQGQLQNAEAQLQNAEAQLQNAEAQLQKLRSQLTQMRQAKTEIESEFEAIEAQLSRVSTQKRELQAEIGDLQAEREELIEQRETVEAHIEERDRQIEEQDRVIARRETRLAELEVEQEKLERQKADAERDFQLLREGSVALKRGQILASGLVRIIDPATSEQAVNKLLQEANRNALNFVQLGNDNASRDRVIQITKAEVEELIGAIDDGRDHVVQIIAAANYLVGEKRVAVYTKAEPNRLLFNSGEIVAGTSVNPATLNSDQLQQHLQQLLDASGFRARFVGVLDGPIQVGDDRVETLIAFIRQLENYAETVELQAVASRDTYTVGPLRVELLARSNGQILFSTRNPDREFGDLNWAEVWPR